jgi:hypothetical protein
MPVKTTCAAILCLAICHAARGGDVAADATDSAEPAPFDPKGFSLDFRPQIWLPAVNGTVGVGNKTATVDASFLDIVQNTDSVIGLSGRLTLDYDRFEAHTDITWIRLGFDKFTSQSGVQFRTTMSLMISDACVAYQLIPPTRDASGQPGPKLAPYVGARIFWANTQVDGSNASFSDSASSVWAEPILGWMWDTPFADTWRLSVSADVGGFAVNTGLTWQATAMVGLDVPFYGNPSTVSLGIRAISDDYTANDLTLDAVLWGPIIAWCLRF